MNEWKKERKNEWVSDWVSEWAKLNTESNVGDSVDRLKICKVTSPHDHWTIVDHDNLCGTCQIWLFLAHFTVVAIWCPAGSDDVQRAETVST